MPFTESKPKTTGRQAGVVFQLQVTCNWSIWHHNSYATESKTKWWHFKKHKHIPWEYNI